MSKTTLTILTILSAAAGAAVHLLPAPYNMIAGSVLSVFFAHFGVTFLAADSAPAVKKGPTAVPPLPMLMLALTLVIPIAIFCSACSGAQLNADLKKVEACAADPRVDACVAGAIEGAPEPETALACVQLCLAEPTAKSFSLKKPEAK